MQAVADAMVREIATSQIALEKHRKVMRSVVKKKADDDRIEKAQKKLLVYDKYKQKRDSRQVGP